MASKSVDEVGVPGSFILERIHALSGIVVFYFSLRLLADPLALHLNLPLDASRFPAFLLSLLSLAILSFHFLYGLSWFQGIGLARFWKAGAYYVSRRLVFLPALFFFAYSIARPFLALEPQDPRVLGMNFLSVAFVYYGTTLFCDGLWDWGLMARRSFWNKSCLALHVILPLLAFLRVWQWQGELVLGVWR